MHNAATCTILALALAAASAGCGRAQHAAPPPLIDWRTSPLDLNLRGMNGTNYLFRCPPGKPAPDSVTGSGVYTDASSICPAAAHAGVITPHRGGLVMIQILPGQSNYRGTTQNFIFSADYAQKWGGSFAVLSGTDIDADHKR